MGCQRATFTVYIGEELYPTFAAVPNLATPAWILSMLSPAAWNLDSTLSSNFSYFSLILPKSLDMSSAL